MNINLGCGNDIMTEAGWVNHDLMKHRPEVTECFDLNIADWPIANESYEAVRAWDVLEHLNEPLHAMNEIHRILKPGGLFTAKCCGWKNPNYWVDITHKKAFDVRSMDYLDPTTEIGTVYSYYTDRKWEIMLAEEDRRGNPHFKLKKL